MEHKHDLFLCHTKANKDWVRNLATSIENETFNNRNLKVFFDEWDIRPGQNIVIELGNALRESRFVGVVLSKEMLNADWPEMEWTAAVYNDPSGRKGSIIPMWLGGCDIPLPLRIRNVLYFNNDLEHRKSYKKLISLLKNEPLHRSPQITNTLSKNNENINSSLVYHDAQQEQLASNLFPVLKFPDEIWSGAIGSLKSRDIFMHLKKTVKGVHPPFIIKEKQIYSFWSLEDRLCPFKELLIASNIKKEFTNSWVHDSEKNKWLIELFNAALKSHCWNLELQHDTRWRFFFRPFGGIDRSISWDTGKRKTKRNVTTRRTKGKQTFWSHQSLRAKFMRLGHDIFLQLIPGWVFTSDGERSLTGRDVGIFSTKWTSRERNSSVLNNVRFWSNILSQSNDTISINLGNSILSVDTTPAVTELSVGIEGDFNPFNKVFEIADQEIKFIESERTELLREEDNNEQ